jgi:hypothetical protein
MGTERRQYAEVYEYWDSSDATWVTQGWVPGSGDAYNDRKGRYGMTWVTQLGADGWRVVARAAAEAADSGPGYGVRLSRDVWTLERSVTEEPASSPN